MATWNPWHGCHKYSEGCQNCYVYRFDHWNNKDSNVVYKNKTFDLPVKKNRKKAWKIPSGEIVYTCFSSDFFLEEADDWRDDAWEMIKERYDLSFYIVTKRIDRIKECLPYDWEKGYRNVTICCTVENQRCADYRLPIFKVLPIVHKEIICEPLLERINLSVYLDNSIECVTVGGESGDQARICDYDWILDIRNQCQDKKINFRFKQTGAKFQKEGKIFHIPRKHQLQQAQKAQIDISI